MKPLMLKGGRVIDPGAGIGGEYDVMVIDGEIDAVEPTGSVAAPEGAEMLDCTGLWVVPGLIDPHVHLRDPGFPQKETIISGLRAAAAGGFTAVAAMANTLPVNDTPAITRYMLERAREAHAARLVPVSAVTKGLSGRELTNFVAMAEAGARLFSDDGIPIDDEAILTHAFAAASRIGFSISLHEEDRALTGHGACNAGEISKRLGVAGIPIAAEVQRMRRDLAIAVGSGAPVHIAHVSTAEGVDLVRAARERRANITCEVTPHHFMLDDRAFARFGPDAKMAPPLRSPRDVEAIRAALVDGTIDMIATDHAPHDPLSKCHERFAAHFSGDRDAGPLAADDAEALAGAANGIVGLETALGLAMNLVHHGIIDAPRMVTLMAAAPAQLLRLDRQGTLAPGAEGDITVIDPLRAWTVEPAKFLSLGRNTPFRGMTLKGRAMFTIVAGKIVYSRTAAGNCE
jgi:dihydroorotase